MSCILMSSNSIIPGVAMCVVSGYSATVVEALVILATSWDLPELGRPITTTGAEVVGALVLGHNSQHLFKGSYLFPRTFSLTEDLFGTKILRWQVSWHS